MRHIGTLNATSGSILATRRASMPAWLAAAMRLLVGSPGRAALTGASAATLGAGFIPDLPDFDIPFLGDRKGRRRRRRRALTASDRADIAFIAGILGAPAGRQFAMLVATRTSS